MVRFLEKRGFIQRDEDQAFLPRDSDLSAMDQVRFSSITYLIALGKHKGQKALTLKTLSEREHKEKKTFLSRYSGFSLHAGVSTKAHQREKLERICRYISRPSLSEQRLSMKLPKLFRNPTTFPLFRIKICLLQNKAFKSWVFPCLNY